MDLSKTHQNKPYIFLDTCVIQGAGSKEKPKSEIIISALKEIGQDYRLAISEFTIFENLHGLWGKRAIVASELHKGYERKVVSSNVLILASVLGGLYFDEGFQNIDSGDKIIAATAILENGFVLTENHKDYPHPFFLTERSIVLTYITAGKYKKTVDLAIYKPDFSLIWRRIGEKDEQK